MFERWWLVAILAQHELRADYIIDTKATTILSMGPPRANSPHVKSFGGTTPTQRNPVSAESELSQVVIRTGTATTLDVQLPVLYVLLTKFGIDGFQLWADDATQWAERAFDERRLDQSRDASLIGSRFFARSGSLGTVETVGGASKSQTIVSVNLDRGGTQWHWLGDIADSIHVADIQLFIPRQRSIESTEVLPFEITASGLEILLEMKPDGKVSTCIDLQTWG